MFTVHARHNGNGQHTETQCATLDEALLHLREIITSELQDPEGPLYWEYGISFAPAIAANVRPPSYHHPKACGKLTPRLQRPRTAQYSLSRLPKRPAN